MKSIIFSKPMITAILKGRKSQTRRVVPGDSDLKKIQPRYKAHEIIYVKEPFFYDSDESFLYLKYENNSIVWADCPWKSAIVMPEKFSRIKLKITSVNIAKLQDISESDALKEGINSNNETAKESYRALINSIYKKNIWLENPFVFVYDFEIFEVRE